MRWNLRDFLTGGRDKTLEELHGPHGSQGPGAARPASWTPAREAAVLVASGAAGRTPVSLTTPLAGQPERRKGTVEAMNDLLQQITNAVRGLTDGNNSAAEKRDVELRVQIVAVQTKLDAVAKQLDAILVNQANLAAHVGMGGPSGQGGPAAGDAKGSAKA